MPCVVGARIVAGSSKRSGGMGKKGAFMHSARFVRDNLELLGFGSRKDALAQAVKELFENALDATNAMSEDRDWDDAHRHLLRIGVRESSTKHGFLDIVCADTGGGMQVHSIKTLCCDVFETSKRSGAAGAAPTAGKYGVGLKAAVLYAQLFDSNACLRVVTTSSSAEILCVSLQIDPESENGAVIQNVAHFAVSESHQRFSGTEMRLTVPSPEEVGEIEVTADRLAMYFQSLGYTLPPFVTVTFSLEVGETRMLVELKHNREPVDRFISEFSSSTSEVMFEYRDTGGLSVSCMASLKTSEPLPEFSQVDVCLLRYANHVPLLSADDFYICGITCGVAAQKTWKRYGLRCRETSTSLVNQLAASAIRPTDKSSENHALLVVAVDVCDPTGSAGVKYGSMRKTHVDKGYAKHVQSCFAALLRRFEDAGRLLTPQQQQLRQLTSEFAPLVVRAALAITGRSYGASRPDGSDTDVRDESAVVRRLQRAICHQASLSSQ